MANSVPVLTAFNPPNGIDETNTRMWLRGKLVFGAGNYVTGGLLPSYSPLLQTDGEAVTLPTLKAANPITVQVTAFAVTSNVVTLTAVNSLAVGQTVNFGTFGTATFLNNQSLVVASATSGSFTVAFTTGNVSTTTDFGTATLITGPDELILTSDTGSGFIYQYIPSTGRIVILESSGGTPAGTIVSTSTAPTITTGTNATVTAVIATNGGALTQATGATGITGVQAPVITSTFTGSAGTASPLTQLTNGGALPSGVTSDSIHFIATWTKN